VLYNQLDGLELLLLSEIGLAEEKEVHRDTMLKLTVVGGIQFVCGRITLCGSFVVL